MRKMITTVFVERNVFQWRVPMQETAKTKLKMSNICSNRV